MLKREIAELSDGIAGRWGRVKPKRRNENDRAQDTAQRSQESGNPCGHFRLILP